MSPRARRLARGWVAAFLATTLAAGSHAAVDGTWPSPLIIALSMCLAAPLCMLLAGRALSRWSVAGSVLLSQALLHTLYAPNRSPSTSAARPPRPGPTAEPLPPSRCAATSATP